MPGYSMTTAVIMFLKLTSIILLPRRHSLYPLITVLSRKVVMCHFWKKKKKFGKFFFLGESGKLRLIMVYCHISKDLKERVLWLISHNYAPDDICELFDISPRSFARWKQNNRVYGSVIPPPNPMLGRPRILNSDMTHNLHCKIQSVWISCV
jgi:hypothetical protein